MSRAARQCHRHGCSSEAEWQLYLKFTAVGSRLELVPFDMQSSLKCCDRHRRVAAEWVLHPKHLDVIADGLARENFRPPHPSTIKIEFAKLNRPDLKDRLRA